MFQLLAAVLVAVASSAEPPTIRDLDFLTGSWRGELGPMTVEEVWLEPKAGNMTGVFRMAGPEGVGLVEIMTIDETDDGAVYRLRHFDTALVPWADEIDGPIEAAVRVDGPGKAVFTPTDESTGVESITYDRTGDRLTATLEFLGSTGRDPFVLTFRRVD